MPSCSEMKVGEVYHCPSCNMELKVVKECESCQGPDHEPCKLACCGHELVKKEA